MGRNYFFVARRGDGFRLDESIFAIGRAWTLQEFIKIAVFSGYEPDLYYVNGCDKDLYEYWVRNNTYKQIS